MRRDRHRRAKVAVGLASLVVLYVGAQALATVRVAPQTEVMGITIGGLSTADARSLVTEAAVAANEGTFAMTAAGWEYTVAAAEAGLVVDADATMARAAGFTLDPARLWQQLAGAGEIEPVTVVVSSELDGALKQAAQALDREAVNASVVIHEARATAVAGQPAVRVNVEESAQVIEQNWPASDVIELTAQVVAPDVVTEEAERLARNVNDYVFAEPVTLTGPHVTMVFTPTQLSEFLSVDVDGASLVLRADGEALSTELLARDSRVINSARDASIVFDKDHMLQVDPGQPARVIDEATLGDAMVLAATSLSRVGAIPYIETPPAVTAEEVSALDFVERISSFSTSFTPRGWARERNIAQAAEYISGIIVKPGETFSINSSITPITRARGYVDAGAIVNGEHVDVPGGGLSQMGTTMYNAAYWAGVDLVEHKPHSEWFARYPAGREATLFIGVHDVKWKNDTPYAILINSYVDNARIYVDLWSTPYYEVQASSSTTPPTRWGLGCAKPGFSITDYRKVYLDGKLIKDESRRWSYRTVDFCSIED
ncbi:MAG: hypothetical protein CVT64_07535 [Actinobacteria bacterium HGW-Actinobacteria-4]|nr:MAG: hypothetical protein CVT64_07535 [Actinobacteria bacterium HGW-Actinobacteria-4]